jgi:hypothetical protein
LRSPGTDLIRRAPFDDDRPLFEETRPWKRQALGAARSAVHSHSIVAGGLDVTSYTTRVTPGTSLTIRDEIFASTS